MKKINVIIPAAGSARRLRPLTNSKPKSLLTINGKSIISHQLDNFPADKIEKVTIILGHMGSKIKEHVDSLSYSFPISYIINSKYENTNCAYSLMQASSELLEGALLINCDLLFKKNNIDRILESDYSNVVNVRKINNYKTDLQKIKVHDDRIIKWSLNLRDANAEIMGPIKISQKAAKEITLYYKSQKTDERLKLHCFSLISNCITKLDFHPIYINDSDWFEIDTIEDLENAESFL